jgi:hypothetical protein
MNGAEWFEAYTNASSNGLTALAILLTMVSGYMVIAYLVGDKLTLLQVSLVNTVYAISGYSVLLSNYGSVLDSATARAEASHLVPELKSIVDSGASPEMMALIVSSINALFIFISLLFMWQVRHPKKE